jgi:hypothetical protein
MSSATIPERSWSITGLDRRLPDLPTADASEQAPLGPGERDIEGRRFYSAAWLGPEPSQLDPEPGPRT